ncbi:hypothetical protein Nmel_005864, partial [Mimus melanotis]
MIIKLIFNFKHSALRIKEHVSARGSVFSPYKVVICYILYFTVIINVAFCHLRNILKYLLMNTAHTFISSKTMQLKLFLMLFDFS